MDQDNWQPLVRTTLEKKIKMTIENVLGIWQLPNPWIIQGRTMDIVWMEKGDEESGLEHIFEAHHREFPKRGISKDEMSMGGPEEAEAITDRALPSHNKDGTLKLFSSN